RDNILFLIHGRRQQNITLFRERILLYLSEEAQPHHIVALPIRQKGSQSVTAADWEYHLHLALSEQLSLPHRTTPALLSKAAAELPLFISVGEAPIGRLPTMQEEALGEFLAS